MCKQNCPLSNDPEGSPARSENLREGEVTARDTGGRRRFLRRSAVATGAIATGGAVLGLAPSSSTATASAAAAGKGRGEKAGGGLVLKLREHRALSKIGGSVTVEVGDDEDEKIIVARTDANTFVTCSAICPHAGAGISYDHATRQFVCLEHRSRFALDGRVLRGPARQPLKSHATDIAAVVDLKPPA